MNTEQPSIKAILGLGNPTPELFQTRHNMGHLCVELLGNQKKLKFLSERFLDVAEWSLGTELIIVSKSRTYMNQSGLAVLDLVRKFGFNPDEIAIVYDDMDLPLGKLRIKKEGSSGGHRGLSSVINSLGSNEFPRLRFGIGHPMKENVVDYVLGTFTKKDVCLVDKILHLGIEALEMMCLNGLDIVMNRYNGETITS